jgi:uncharacterized protein DUF6570
MDHPRGGKHLHFDGPLAGYPSRRQRPSQPTASTTRNPAVLPATAPTIQPPSTSTFASPVTIDRPSAPSTVASPQPPRSRLLQHRDIAIVPTQLIENHQQRQAATARFPPEISDSCVRESLGRYQDHMSAVIAAIEIICGSCGKFIEQQVFRLPAEDPLLLPFRADAASPPRLDSCSMDGSDYLFCLPCFTAIRQKNPPKYSALNGVNVDFCQNHPAALEDLTLTEECLIARGHPVASILKLRPHGASYSRLRGHVIVLPQEPGPLFDILPSAELNLQDKIKVRARQGL